ncbi:MAG: hypothetical protein AAGH41_13415 [Pseudomonadota bacterium]
MISAALLLLTSASASPQAAEEAEVLAVVDAFFEAYYAKDVDGFYATLMDDARGRSVRPDGAGGLKISPNAPVAEVFGDLSQFPTVVEVYWDPEVRIRGGVAQFWAPYYLEVNGVPIHCGIDAFTLIQSTEGWKLHSLDYTAEPDACSALGYDRANEDLRPRSLVGQLSKD